MYLAMQATSYSMQSLCCSPEHPWMVDREIMIISALPTRKLSLKGSKKHVQRQRLRDEYSSY